LSMSDQPQPDTGALNVSTICQTIVTFSGGLSIDASGMTYLGKRIEDAGEAYAAFMAVTSGAHHQTESALNNALVEIERLRDALRDISTTAHCISKAGPLNTKTLAEAWNKFDHISVEATGAIKPPKK
jgi:hypothetical protein